MNLGPQSRGDYLVTTYAGGKKSRGEQRRRQRARLFEAQGGRCYWCQRPMRLMSPIPHPQPDDACTTEHLDPKGSPLSGLHSHSGICRVVVACYGCNNRRGNRTDAAYRPITLGEIAGPDLPRP